MPVYTYIHANRNDDCFRQRIRYFLRFSREFSAPSRYLAVSRRVLSNKSLTASTSCQLTVNTEHLLVRIGSANSSPRVAPSIQRRRDTTVLLAQRLLPDNRCCFANTSPKQTHASPIWPPILSIGDLSIDRRDTSMIVDDCEKRYSREIVFQTSIVDSIGTHRFRLDTSNTIGPLFGRDGKQTRNRPSSDRPTNWRFPTVKMYG